MPKNKRQKYQRVKYLPNVIVAESVSPVSSCAFPWFKKRYAGMKRVIELGCGKGEHSLAFAAADPETLCVGVDYKSHRLCVGAEEAIAKGLDNVHFLRARIEHLESFFIQHSVDEIWLTFPDPHPKHRNGRFRLTAPPFLETYAKLLISGGNVHLKTDSDLIFDYTRKTVVRWGGQVVAVLDDLHEAGDGIDGARDVVSAFEFAARLQGATIKYMAFQLT